MKYNIYGVNDDYELVELGSFWSRDFAYEILREFRDGNAYREVWIDEPNILWQFVLDLLRI